MDLGLHIANFTWPDSPASTAETLANVAVAADEGGYASLSVMDHFFQMDHFFDAAEPMLEGYTTLGYPAAVTERVRLGLLVTGVTYRHPGLVAKTVTTVDVLSGGRGELGIGAAWYEREHVGLGVPYPPPPSVSSGSRRRCRSASRCGAKTTAATPASTTSLPRP
jgi:alkanesulfonate monooxygenase SsuD/methylene tetrahydromethanopterin reductase-like flavin-dependent oxidoreductase (luciferase family)